MPRRPPVQPDPDDLSDRNREALEALRRLWAQPPALTEEEIREWIREVRLMGEASDCRMLEQFEPAREKPVAPPPGDDPAARPGTPDLPATNTLRSKTMPRRPPGRPDRTALSARNREALEALRSLRGLPRARTKEETEAWIREIRLERQASTRHMLEKIARALEKPDSEDPTPKSSRLRPDSRTPDSRIP